MNCPVTGNDLACRRRNRDSVKTTSPSRSGYSRRKASALPRELCKDAFGRTTLKLSEAAVIFWRVIEAITEQRGKHRQAATRRR